VRVEGDAVHERSSAAYQLAGVRERIRAGRYVITGRVRRYLRAKKWDDRYVRDCLLALDESDFHKSQQHVSRAEVWLDIYRPWVEDQRLYMKITVLESGDELLILSFCVDSEAH